MIRIYRAGCQDCEEADALAPGWRLPNDAIWIDLIAPTRDEDLAVEEALGLSVPTREEMVELEASSRLYRENGATYVTADIIHHGDADLPTLDPVTFILTPGPLVTIRYFDPKPFSMVLDKVGREPELCRSGADLFLNLMEAVIDRASDILSANAARVEVIGEQIFGGRPVRFERLLNRLGRAQIANARIEQSLAGFARLFSFVTLDERVEAAPTAREHLRSLTADASSLLSHNQSIAAAINFQLSAALGLINIQQSSILKIFSVVTVCLMPPTLIGAIYGMNFDHMPELRWAWGYPLALAAMAVSGLAPLLWFKQKGWLWRNPRVTTPA